MTANPKDKLRRLVDIAKETARLEVEGERLIEELAPVAAVPARPRRTLVVVDPIARAAHEAPPGSEPVPTAVPGTTLLDRIAGLLVATPSGISIDALASATGAKHKSVRASLSQLKAKDRAAVVSRGVWGAP